MMRCTALGCFVGVEDSKVHLCMDSLDTLRRSEYNRRIDLDEPGTQEVNVDLMV